MNVDEIRDFINDVNKQVTGSIVLRPARNNTDAYQFRRPIVYDGEQEVSLNIWFNPSANLPKLEVAYFVPGVGRIYGLCLNKAHAGMLVHKHNGKKGEDSPYFPRDITARADNPQAVWTEFCTESSLAYDGEFTVAWRGPWIPPLTEA